MVNIHRYSINIPKLLFPYREDIAEFSRSKNSSKSKFGNKVSVYNIHFLILSSLNVL